MQSLLYSVAILLNAAVLGQSTSSTDETQASEADNRMVCRNIRKTGTRFDTRICKRVSEWRTIEDKSTTAVREIQGRPQINCTTPSGSAC